MDIGDKRSFPENGIWATRDGRFRVSGRITMSRFLVGDRHRRMRWVNYSPACHLTKAPRGYRAECDFKARACGARARNNIPVLTLRDQRTGSLRDLRENARGTSIFRRIITWRVTLALPMSVIALVTMTYRSLQKSLS